MQSWSGTNDYTSNPSTVTMNSNKHIMVNWETHFGGTINNQPLLSSSISFIGGIVFVNPAPDSDGTYAKNTRVTFTAVPAAGYRFDHWGGEISGTVNPIVVIFNTQKNISVVFVKTYNLTTLASPTQGGSIYPAGSTYDEGVVVTVTATAAAGYRFDHWEGAASGSVPTISVTMNADKTVVAVFVKTYTLTVTVSPALSGAVSPSGGTFDTGANVTLTAMAAAGYRFDHWEGNTSGSTISVTITMNANKSVTAVFIKTYILSVTINPVEGGSVSPIGGIYDIGSNVTLTAVPATGYRFDHWEGAASGNETSIIITMDANKSVTAVFVSIAPIAVTTNPTAGSSAFIAGSRFERYTANFSGNAATAIILNDHKNIRAALFFWPK
ncbi:MAG: InlB B-repeat-containing protein [Dehalococcoidales bacterium]